MDHTVLCKFSPFTVLHKPACLLTYSFISATTQNVQWWPIVYAPAISKEKETNNFIVQIPISRQFHFCLMRCMINYRNFENSSCRKSMDGIRYFGINKRTAAATVFPPVFIVRQSCTAANPSYQHHQQQQLIQDNHTVLFTSIYLIR